MKVKEGGGALLPGFVCMCVCVCLHMACHSVLLCTFNCSTPYISTHLHVVTTSIITIADNTALTCCCCCPLTTPAHTPQELRVLQLVEVLGLSPHDIALLPYLAAIHRLTLIAAREDSWLGLGPLRLLTRLQELRHLDWVVSDKALSGRHSKAPELQALTLYPKLHVLTVHTLLGRCEQLHAVSGQLNPGCSVRLMTPAFCEHASKKTGFGIGKLLGVASCLLPGTVPVM